MFSCNRSGINTVSLVACLMSVATPSLAFETVRDAKICQKELEEFHQQAAITSVMLLKADQSTHPRSGFLRHADVFRKRAWLRAHSGEGSDAFYELPNSATAEDCRKLEDKLSKSMFWLAKYVAVRDPDRCRKYKFCG